MGRYTVIPENAFQALQLDAGVLLNNFDVDAATSGGAGFTDENVICATTGGINVSCVAEYSDFAEDVDNAPNNLKEFKHLDGWNCILSTNSLGTSPELIKLALGAADISGNKIIPRRNLKQADFSDIWWVGDRADNGLVAVQILNALSTGGFSLQTGKNAKGQTSLEITGHVSINEQDKVPMQFYSIEPDASIVDKYTVTFNSNGGSSVQSQQIKSGDKIAKPSDPTKSGSTFAGWYSNSTLTAAWNFNTGIVSENMTLYAKWS